MSILTGQPGRTQLPAVTPPQRQAIVSELSIRQRTYANYGHTYRDRAAIQRADELTDIIKLLGARQ